MTNALIITNGVSELRASCGRQRLDSVHEGANSLLGGELFLRKLQGRRCKAALLRSKPLAR